MRIEPRLAPVDALHRAEPPWAEQRRDPRRPRPLAHAVELLAVLDLVAVGELLVGQDVPVRVHDPLCEPGRARRVVELGWIVRRRVLTDEVGRRRRQRLLVDHERVRRPRPVEARRILGIGHEDACLRVREPVLDPVVAVEHRHREQDRAELPDTEEDRRRLRRRRQHDRHPVATGHTPRGERVRRLVRQILQLTPIELADRAVKALPHHRRLVSRVLVADVGGNVVALRHDPAVGGTHLVVAPSCSSDGIIACPG